MEKESGHIVVSRFTWFESIVFQYTIKVKLVLITFVIHYTIYFTFESLNFRSYHHCYLKGAININRKIIKKEEASTEIPFLSRGVVDHSEVGGPTFVNCW